ncbi:hypothetical protein BSNK01_11850 [Bacillaceae bacterium]
MDWFSIVKRYYDRGYYTKSDVAKFVQYGKITAEQYEQIVGEPYPTA